MSTFHLHHNGYLTSDIERDAVAFVERFGYVRESDIIHDSFQTALVLFLRLPGGRSWLELVMPDGPASKLTRRLKKTGEGWHHICYEVSDLVEAGNHLRMQRMLQLCEPVSATAFFGRRISWFMDCKEFLTELVESSKGNEVLSAMNLT